MEILNAYNMVWKSLRDIQEVQCIVALGSLASDYFDENSDIDLYCIVKMGEIDRVISKLRRCCEKYRKLIHYQVEMIQDLQFTGIFDNGIQVEIHVEEIGEPIILVGNRKILYDIGDITSKIPPVQYWQEKEVMLKNYYDSCFTLHEIRGIYRRGDLKYLSWLNALLVRSACVVIRGVFDFEKMIIGLKGIEKVVPERINREIEEITEIHPKHGGLDIAIRIGELMRSLIPMIPEDIRKDMNPLFLDKAIEWLKAEK